MHLYYPYPMNGQQGGTIFLVALLYNLFCGLTIIYDLMVVCEYTSPTFSHLLNSIKFRISAEISIYKTVNRSDKEHTGRKGKKSGTDRKDQVVTLDQE